MDPYYYTKFGWKCIFLGALWIACIFSVVLASLPRNPVSLPYVPKLIIKTIAPEGWSFFTRNPRENLIYIFQRDSGRQWLQPSHVYNGSMENYFGMSRKARAIGSEYALLFSQSAVLWDSCSTGTFDCIDEQKKFLVRNQLKAPQLCGEYLFVSRAPVPWAWSEHTEKIHMPFQYVLVEFVCQ
ncbi:SdpA family antimicrobial peptide system protein [Pseudochryseolinea flava]|uniref:Antimicrobial peptide system protein, SdpA family n=1 Tax=Pseudochryseolinea flava TaxID=2059302 RepID=A0A364YAU0_9BACT|nr:SdpA family antimicrobial peptide system protein [Pseudochryseolinea flava]RAW03475.1 hypothetical protein DQQ10_05165 [Pseudochryseolinea flava]